MNYCIVLLHSFLWCVQTNNNPDSKVHGVNMGSIWGRQDPGGPHVGPMNFAIWERRNQSDPLVPLVRGSNGTPLNYLHKELRMWKLFHAMTSSYRTLLIIHHTNALLSFMVLCSDSQRLHSPAVLTRVKFTFILSLLRLHRILIR